MTVVLPMPRVTGVQEFVDEAERRIDLLVAEERRRWLSMVTSGGSGAVDGVEGLFAHLAAAVLGGGKRLRPTFCYWGAVGVTGGPVRDSVVGAAAALELLHAFALVHDDVMDGSATRRGRPALHTRIAAEHHRRGWHGEQRRAGEGMAILVGDLAFALAQRLVSDLTDDARLVWHDICTELVVGQRLDIHGSHVGDRDTGYARLVASLKSGHYTIVGPLMLGATVAGGDGSHHATYEAFGGPLGEAFQLRDDLLGVFGDPEVTGKPVGEDLRAGNPTLLLALANEVAGPDDRRILGWVGRPDLDDGDVDRVTEVLVRTGAKDEVERRIDLAAGTAVAALSGTTLDPAAVSGLRRVAEEVSWRRR